MSILRRSIVLFGGLAALACSDNESPPVDENHTPVSYTVEINGFAVNAPYTFTAGETARVRIKFFNAAGEDLDDVESSHYGGLAFDPTSLATAARVNGHNYQFDVTGMQAGEGTLLVSFGHDPAADEHSLPPAGVMVDTDDGGGELSQ